MAEGKNFNEEGEMYLSPSCGVSLCRAQQDFSLSWTWLASSFPRGLSN